AVQAIANSRLGQLGETPITGAVVNFVVGLVLLTGVAASGFFGRPKWSALSEAPLWSWCGGLIGATFVTTMIVAVPRIGAVTAFAAIILGQLLASTVIDSYGLLGMQSTPLSGGRIAGLVLIAAGVFLTQR
ncbi:MAG: DMT family transporter, partial [Myxococcota bacterium]